MQYLNTLMGKAKVKKRKNTNVGVSPHLENPNIHTVLVECMWTEPLWKMAQQYLLELSMAIHEPTALLPSTCPQRTGSCELRDPCKNVHRNIFHHSPSLETTQGAISSRMGTYVLIYLPNRISCSNENAQNTRTTRWTNLTNVV